MSNPTQVRCLDDGTAWTNASGTIEVVELVTRCTGSFPFGTICHPVGISAAFQFVAFRTGSPAVTVSGDVNDLLVEAG